MTPEEKNILEATYKIAQENNEMLRSIRRTTKLQTTMKLLYWLVILLVGFGAYYFIQPYIDALMEAFGAVGGLSGFQQNINELNQAYSPR